jgi:hypothetical protein
MLQTCLLALTALAIVLYVQSRRVARDIRRNRACTGNRQLRDLTLGETRYPAPD